MRYLLTLLVGFAIGFGLASWKPARDVVNAEKIASVASKVHKSALTNGDEATSAQDEVDVRALASGAGAGSDVGRVEGAVSFLAQNDQGSSLDTVNDLTGGLGFSMAAFAVNAVDHSAGADGEAYDASADIAQFEAVKVLIAEENAAIDEYLKTLDPRHPQYSLLSCYRVSNESSIGLFDFWIQVAKDQDATDESVLTLANVFAENQTRINALSESGRGAALGYSLVLRVLPAKTDTDRAIKSKSLEILDTYAFAFDVEDALAAHNLEFITMLGEPAATEEAAIANLEAWSVSMSKLVEARVGSQMERDRLSDEILAIAPTS